MGLFFTYKTNARIRIENDRAGLYCRAWTAMAGRRVLIGKFGFTTSSSAPSTGREARRDLAGDGKLYVYFSVVRHPLSLAGGLGGREAGKIS